MTLRVIFASAVIFMVTAFVYAVFFAVPYNPNKDPDAYPQPCYERVLYTDKNGFIRELILIGDCHAT